MQSLIHRLACGHLVLVDNIEPCALNCRQSWGSQQGTFRCFHCTKAALDAQCEHAITRLKIEAYGRGLGATGEESLRQDIKKLKTGRYEQVRSRMQDPEARCSRTLKRSMEICDTADLLSGIELDTQPTGADLDRCADIEARGRNEHKNVARRDKSRSPTAAGPVDRSSGTYRQRSPLRERTLANVEYRYDLALRPRVQHRISTSAGRHYASKGSSETISSSGPSATPIQFITFPGPTRLHSDIKGTANIEMNELDRRMKNLGMSTVVGTPRLELPKTGLTRTG